MTVIRMAARRHHVIDKTVPQAAEEWMADRLGSGHDAPPVVHHLADQALHFGYGALLGAAYGLLVDGRSRTGVLRGLGFGVATWAMGSWGLLPLLGAKRAPWRKKQAENAVDLLAHLVFGAATALVAEELSVQSDRGPTPDSVRHRARVG